MSGRKLSGAEESELVARARRGDRQAFGELVVAYRQPVYYLAYRFTRDHDSSDELAQECFVKAYLALDSFVEGRSFRNWLFAIVSHLAINYLKAQKRKASLDDPPVQETLADPRPAGDPHEQAVGHELERHLARAINRLPPEFKAVFVLRTYEQLSYEEIAGMLKIEVGTVMSRLFRARARVREDLKGFLE